ncbi:MAG: hypothetical protein ACE15C_19650 [Phycisphaerae bacterium]
MNASANRNEPRVLLANEAIRLDFDPRTSDTMYNYIHVRRQDDGRWERLHNFGVDVRCFMVGPAPTVAPDGPGSLINGVGMALDIRADAGRATVRYPKPLIRYRQFDDKIGSPELVRKYPDFTLQELPSLEHAEAEVEFTYELDGKEAAFTIRGRVISGTVPDITYIIDALWTDNRACPTHEYVEGFPEFSIAAPEGVYCKNMRVRNVAFAIFYRHDGNGVPFALLPLEPTAGGFCNYYDNWKCNYDFNTCSRNQSFIPQSPCVTGCNDAGYLTSPHEDGRLPGVKVAFFPELAYLRGGQAHQLRERIVQAIKDRHWDAVRSWGRPAIGSPPEMTLTGFAAT